MICIFQNNDAEYLAWLAANPGGHVVNTRRAYSPSDSQFSGTCGKCDRGKDE